MVCEVFANCNNHFELHYITIQNEGAFYVKILMYHSYLSNWQHIDKNLQDNPTINNQVTHIKKSSGKLPKWREGWPLTHCAAVCSITEQVR